MKSITYSIWCRTRGVHTATKAGAEALTAIPAKELRGRNICVDAVAPGPTATALFLHGKSAGVVERLAKMPLERLTETTDNASASDSLPDWTAAG